MRLTLSDIRGYSRGEGFLARHLELKEARLAASAWILVGMDSCVAGAYTDTETLHSPTFPDLALDLSAVFTTLLIPAEERIDEIRESAPPYDAGAPVP